mmetsp:Transcript_26320/g.39868  ORF Transcript_26320/g.39868 Transcript_26320/m.39868 type:complete len:230 (+) Transcript_26320:452-1141(+)|eukprot:CAMPEP_0178907128 /NCGR_PEP_ID=MMETSP0786-20121207/7200_1 /TAXON_ID=186022 /ORGANISM="Thalassionema frauenfeldii, Strain CCMP 1798" /LENGTH=229 /DNA_ID=CAMNT_0020578895 /DNA_START=379 /DNA_END=1068 /DNA_ORIENTATION=+
MIPQHLHPVVLNNIAVQNLEQGNTEFACKIFASAVKLILSAPMDFSSTEQMFSKSAHFSWSNVVYDNIKTRRNETSDRTFMFSRAICIENYSPTADLTQLSNDMKAGIIYNTGLAFHLIAMENNDSNFLSKARDTYSLSQTILREASMNGIISKLCFDYNFHVILLNNLGQISYELVDYDASSYFFYQLSVNLNHIASQPKNEINFENCDMNGMKSNVIVELPNAAPCA